MQVPSRLTIYNVDLGSGVAATDAITHGLIKSKHHPCASRLTDCEGCVAERTIKESIEKARECIVDAREIRGVKVGLDEKGLTEILRCLVAVS